MILTNDRLHGEEKRLLLKVGLELIGSVRLQSNKRTVKLDKNDLLVTRSGLAGDLSHVTGGIGLDQLCRVEEPFSLLA